MEYFIRIPLSTLKWFENGELVSNPDFSNNMEVFRVGINENYNEIQKIQEDMTTLAPIDSVSGEAQARREADQLIHLRIDDLIAGLPTKLSQFENDTGFTTKTYVDGVQTALQGQLTTLSENVSSRLVPANIIAGSRVSVGVSGNNVTISVDVSDLESAINVINTNLENKLEAADVLAGTNITVTERNGKIVIAGTNNGGAANSVSIVDTGNYFSASTVEGALQELGAELSGVTTALASQSEVVV